MKDLLTIGPALAGISLGRNPNGAVNEVVRSIREARAKRRLPAAERADDQLGRTGIEGFTRADRAHFDLELGLADEPSYARLAAFRGRHGHGPA